jgi:hypothetical protein
VQLDTSAEMQGRIGALQSITLVGSTPIGSPIVGWVCERFGARAGLALGAGAAFVAAAWGASAGRRHPPPASTSSSSSSSSSSLAAAA